jgi:NADH:ubiquinone oxidoreductase subunit D
MVKRVFWFAVGAGVTVFVVIKVRKYMKQATPQAIGSRVADSAAGIGGSVRDFADRARAAMAERETELRDALGLPDEG